MSSKRTRVFADCFESMSYANSMRDFIISKTHLFADS